MITEWYVTRDGAKTAGPLSPQQLEQLYASGRLRPTDLVRPGIEAPWLPASQMNGVFTARAPQPTNEGPAVKSAPEAPAPVQVATGSVTCPHCRTRINFPSAAAPPATCFQCLGRLSAPASGTEAATTVAQSGHSPWLVGVIAAGGLLLMVLVVGGALAYWMMLDRSAAPPVEAAEAVQAPAATVPPAPPPPRPLPAVPLAPPPEVWTGHTAMIRTVAFSTDGLRALSGSGGYERRNDEWVLSSDNTVRLWDARTGREIKALRGFKDGISSVAFSPDGKYAVLCTCGRWKGDEYVPAKEFGIRLWDLVEDRELSKLSLQSGPATEDASQSTARFQGHASEVFGVAFSPDGRRVLSGSKDRTVRLWDVATGQELRQLIGHKSSVYKVEFSPDGRRALTCSADKTVRLWDLEDGRELHKMEGHQDYVWAVAFTPDGKYGASAGGSQQQGGKIIRGAGDYDIRLWDLDTGLEVRRFQGHRGTVGGVAFTPDGRYLLSCGCWQRHDDEKDSSVRLWEVATGKEVRRYAGHHGSVGSVAVSPDGRYALSGGWAGSLRLWDISSRR